MDFCYCVQKFSAYIFLGELLRIFVTNLNSASNFASFDNLAINPFILQAKYRQYVCQILESVYSTWTKISL